MDSGHLAVGFCYYECYLGYGVSSNRFFFYQRAKFEFNVNESWTLVFSVSRVLIGHWISLNFRPCNLLHLFSDKLKSSLAVTYLSDLRPPTPTASYFHKFFRV